MPFNHIKIIHFIYYTMKMFWYLEVVLVSEEDCLID